MRSASGPWLVVGAGILLIGCSKPPAEELRAVEEAFRQAEAVEAASYAPESFDAAADARARLDAELAAQEDKFGLFRSYGRVSELALEAKNAAQRAVADSETGRAEAQMAAEGTVNRARAVLEEARTLLRRAPGGKGSRADLAMMSADLDGVETALFEAEGALGEGRYLDAKTGAEAALGTAESVKNEIENALETVRGARRR